MAILRKQTTTNTGEDAGLRGGTLLKKEIKSRII
jgi:hypothetical protein